jgi:hypothetical protein
MNPRTDHRSDVRQNDSHGTPRSRLFLVVVGLLEVVVASLVVVGFFAAASQPFGWSSAVQFLLCALLGGLLLYADRNLDVEDSLVPTNEHPLASRAPARR